MNNIWPVWKQGDLELVANIVGLLDEVLAELIKLERLTAYSSSAYMVVKIVKANIETQRANVAVLTSTSTFTDMAPERIFEDGE
jgi:hypothetical protein